MIYRRRGERPCLRRKHLHSIQTQQDQVCARAYSDQAKELPSGWFYTLFY